MKTIVFHSYKGGVGRTLALANVGVALNRIGKKVLMLDMDFEAPGLAYKFGLEDKVKGGYVDYLYDIAAQYHKKTDQTEEGHDRNPPSSPENYPARIKTLCKHILSAGNEYPNLYILPAGQAADPSYWKKQGSEYFQCWFRLNDSEDSRFFSDTPLNREVMYSFLRDDPALMSNTLEPLSKNNSTGLFDYLLIDCKSGSEWINAIPILLWANTVVELFAHNKEGAFSAAYYAWKLHYFKENRNKSIRLIPIITRIPNVKKYREYNEKGSFHKNYKSYWKQLNTYSHKKYDVPHLNPLFFHEYRNIEGNEKLLLNNRPENTESVLLMHDYINLLRKLFPHISEQFETSRPTLAWHDALNISENVQLIEKYMQLHLQEGTLVNAENNAREVSLRTKTLASLLNSIVEDMQTQFRANAKLDDTQVENILEQAVRTMGEKSGRSFGEQLTRTGNFWHQITPDNIDTKIAEWCAFDQKSGFGDWDYNAEHRQITVSNFFLESFTYNSTFLEGYVNGVLHHLRLLNDNRPHQATLTTLSTKSSKENYLLDISIESNQAS